MTYMKLKRMLLGRGVDKKQLDTCPSIQHLHQLGRREGVLQDDKQVK